MNEFEVDQLGKALARGLHSAHCNPFPRRGPDGEWTLEVWGPLLAEGALAKVRRVGDEYVWGEEDSRRAPVSIPADALAHQILTTLRRP